jgi:hypothetical protein
MATKKLSSRSTKKKAAKAKDVRVGKKGRVRVVNGVKGW